RRPLRLLRPASPGPAPLPAVAGQLPEAGRPVRVPGDLGPEPAAALVATLAHRTPRSPTLWNRRRAPAHARRPPDHLLPPRRLPGDQWRLRLSAHPRPPDPPLPVAGPLTRLRRRRHAPEPGLSVRQLPHRRGLRAHGRPQDARELRPLR